MKNLGLVIDSIISLIGFTFFFIKSDHVIDIIFILLFAGFFYHFMIKLRHNLYRAVRDGKSLNLINRKFK